MSKWTLGSLQLLAPKYSQTLFFPVGLCVPLELNTALGLLLTNERECFPLVLSLNGTRTQGQVVPSLTWFETKSFSVEIKFKGREGTCSGEKCWQFH